MVSLAVAKRTPLSECRSLRDSALWYPYVLQAGLHLNDVDFLAKDTATTRYQPLCWAIFRGPGGIYLRSIIRLSITCFGAVREIEFYYDNKEVLVGSRKLGRCFTEGINVIYFLIDGPGGEVIDFVTVYFRPRVGDYVFWIYRPWVLELFKVKMYFLFYSGYCY